MGALDSADDLFNLGVSVRALEDLGYRTTASRMLNPTTHRRSSTFPLEANDVEAYVVSHPEEPTSAVRREAALVRDYARWLAQRGRTARRHRIRFPDGRSLCTDCFDESTSEVLEAKGSAARTFIRSGLGQILDYSR